MKHFFARATATVAFLMISLTGLAWADDVVPAAPSAADAVTTADGSRMWFVELQGKPISDGGDLGAIEQDRSLFRSEAAQVGLRYTETRAFGKLWNGIAIAVNPDDVGKLDKIPSLAGFYPIVTFALPDLAPVNEPELLTALAMTGADVAQNTLGLSGAGIKVGIIDTGIDYDNPALGGDGTTRTNSSVFPTGRVVTGYDFVGDAFNGSNTPVPDAYPDDCFGHGSHVAGIVGANGVVRGVAPGVTFGAYRVFGCAGSTRADIMIAAMERALDDGMQVVNMSIGAAFQWPQYPTAAASDRLVNKGVVVVASMGNNGGSLYAGSAPGVGKKVIGVASFDNTYINLPAFSITADGHLIGFNQAVGCPGAPLSGSSPMARTGTVASVADGCLPLPAGSLTGKIALIRRGTCGFYVKARNAELAGAVGVVLYNNAAAGLLPNVAGSPPVTIPVVGISGGEGALIDSRLAAGPVTLTWGGISSVPNSTGGLVSSFSSIGLAPDLSIKPDLGAPGGFILSTIPLEQGGYGSNSGTSMSSPHVAGAVALLLEAHPNTPPNAVRDILMNSAVPGPAVANLSLIEAVSRQGAGMLDIAAAVQATTRIEPGKLSIGESEFGPVTSTLTISNESSSAVTYDLSHMPAVGTGPNTFSVSFNYLPANVTFSQNPVTVPGNSDATVNVTISPNGAQPIRSLYGGYIAITPQDSDQEFRVPYAGIAGDYQSIPALTPGPNGFPWLAKLIGNSFFNRPSGETYSLAGGDLPYFLIHLDHPVQLLRMEVFEAASGKAWHRVLNEKYVGRNSAAGSFFAIPWDGTTLHGNNHVLTVPNGQYVMKVSVLKALGDESNPAHTESWTSPVVTLARSNLAVEGTSLSQSVVNTGDVVTVSSSIRLTGTEPASGVVVTFLDNDAPFHAETIDLAANEARVVQAAWTVPEAPSHRLRVTVSNLQYESDFTDNAFQLDIIPGETIVGVGDVPRVLALAPALPNPFRDDVAFRFSLPEAGRVSVDVFDLLGRRLRTWSWDDLAAGEHSIRWDGRTDTGANAAAGMVLYRLHAMGRTLTEKAVRLP